MGCIYWTNSGQIECKHKNELNLTHKNKTNTYSDQIFSLNQQENIYRVPEGPGEGIRQGVW